MQGTSNFAALYYPEKVTIKLDIERDNILKQCMVAHLPGL